MGKTLNSTALRIVVCVLTAALVMCPYSALAQGSNGGGLLFEMEPAVLIVIHAAVAAVILLIILWLSRSLSNAEEQLEQKEKLLNAEKLLFQTDEMMNALYPLYFGVLRVDLKKDEASCCRADEKAEMGIKEGGHAPFSDWIRAYAGRAVAEANRQEFLEFASPENIRAGLGKENILTYRYLTGRSGEERCEQLVIARTDPEEEGVNRICMAFSDVDKETREAIAERNALSAALAEAEKAGKTKLSFLSSMSHEIRTPINAIIGLDTLALNDDTLSEMSRDCLIKIGDSAQCLLGLINEIFDVSRIEAGSMKLHEEPFQFKTMKKRRQTGKKE